MNSNMPFTVRTYFDSFYILIKLYCCSLMTLKEGL